MVLSELVILDSHAEHDAGWNRQPQVDVGHSAAASTHQTRWKLAATRSSRCHVEQDCIYRPFPTKSTVENAEGFLRRQPPHLAVYDFIHGPLPRLLQFTQPLRQRFPAV